MVAIDRIPKRNQAQRQLCPESSELIGGEKSGWLAVGEPSDPIGEHDHGTQCHGEQMGVAR